MDVEGKRVLNLCQRSQISDVQSAMRKTELMIDPF